MITRDCFRLLSDDKRAKYLFTLCECCAFYNNCELVSDHLVSQVQKSKSASPKVPAKLPRRVETKAQLTSAALAYADVKLNERDRTTAILPYYMRSTWEKGGCPMKGLNQVECGSKWVADGIGDDFKVDVEHDYKSDRYRVRQSGENYKHKWKFTSDKWEPRQPVFISAQTGNGKNYWVEHVLLKYVRELNHKNGTELKVLILSNRIALRKQTQDRLEKGMAEDSDIYMGYNQYAHVMSYHSLPYMADHLRRVQESKDSGYIYVILDECHFFSSDAMFNPNTERILEDITDIFKDAIRVYMTATPYEGLRFILDKEKRQDKSIEGVTYHFKRDYAYLDTKYFSNENTELKGIITDSVVGKNEKWLVFIDNKNQCESFKKLLEYNKDDEATALKGKVMAISAESKDTDEAYQKMIVSEQFADGINVVISTSVIDNGVNFRNIQNVVITDTNQTKCLQMVGRLRVDKDLATGKAKGRVTLYIKRHNDALIQRRLKLLQSQQDAYHAHDLPTHEFQFLNKYYNDEFEDWRNAKHWFGRDNIKPAVLYPNNIARELADTHVLVYESILQEMAATDKGKSVTGQKYLEYQLSWFDKKYREQDDITLSGYKTDGQVKLEKWLSEEWLDKKIPKESQKDFGRNFFAKYNPVFGLCTKKQGFSSDDNRGEGGPRNVGYSLKRIKEIFEVKKLPFILTEYDDHFVISKK